MGYGRRRGGYVCHCKNRFRYPRWLSPPFQGEDVERATEYEYKNNFECIPDQRKFYNENELLVFCLCRVRQFLNYTPLFYLNSSSTQ